MKQYTKYLSIFSYRLSSFPPSYEDSQESQVCPDASPEFMVIVDSTDMLMSLAPPLYSQDSPEAPDCRFSWEQPPPYSEVESIQQGHMDAEELRERLSGHWGKNSFCLTGWEKKRNADCRSEWLPHQAEWESSRTTGNVFMSLDRSSAKRWTAEMCWHHLSAMNLQPSVCHPSSNRPEGLYTGTARMSLSFKLQKLFGATDKHGCITPGGRGFI